MTSTFLRAENKKLRARRNQFQASWLAAEHAVTRQAERAAKAEAKIEKLRAAYKELCAA